MVTSWNVFVKWKWPHEIQNGWNGKMNLEHSLRWEQWSYQLSCQSRHLYLKPSVHFPVFSSATELTACSTHSMTGTHHNTDSTRHRQHVLFIIFRLVHSPLAFSLIYLLVKTRQTVISWLASNQHFLTTLQKSKLSTWCLSITFSPVGVTSLFWLMLAGSHGVRVTGCWLQLT